VHPEAPVRGALHRDGRDTGRARQRASDVPPRAAKTSIQHILPAVSRSRARGRTYLTTAMTIRYNRRPNDTSPAVSQRCDRMTACRSQWHVPLPESVAVCPATGMNFHEYDPSARVSLSTPFTPVMRTSLLAMGVPNG